MEYIDFYLHSFKDLIIQRFFYQLIIQIDYMVNQNMERLADYLEELEGKVEDLAENKQPRYNTKGELLSVDDYVQEFLTQNPHFQAATPSGSGSVSNVGKVDAKPFNIADLDMTNPEDRKRYAEYRKERDTKPTVIKLT